MFDWTILFNLGIIVIAFYIMTKLVDEYFLKSLDNIAGWLKLTPSVAGATLLAMGTSAPELSTAMFSLFLPDADPATGLGTVVGSAIFQILVVIGFASLVRTTYLDWKPVVRDGIFYLIAVCLLILVLQDGQITSVESGGLLFTYLIYLGVLIYWSRKFPENNNDDPIEVIEQGIEKERRRGIFSRGLGKTWMIITSPIDFVINLLPDPEKVQKATLPVFVICLAAIAYASYWLVIAAEGLAGALGIPAAIVALTILAGGSSIPELISSYIISRQGKGDMAISNAIGSNTFDVLVSLGLPVFVFTITNGQPAAAQSQNIVSSLFLLFATLIAVLGILFAVKFKIGRKFGLLLIAAYVAYVIAAYAGILG